MYNNNPNIVEIIDERKPLFECKKCGRRWLPQIKPESNGSFYRGAWQCPYGCRIGG